MKYKHHHAAMGYLLGKEDVAKGKVKLQTSFPICTGKLKYGLQVWPASSLLCLEQQHDTL
jgi:hypothetical protein